MSSAVRLRVIALVLASGLALNSSWAALYPGNGDTSNGGEIGKGSLSLTDNGVTVSATFHRGTAPFDGDLVLFIDCAPGGFTDNHSFKDLTDELTWAISGVNDTGTKRSTSNFAPGFAADYAIALGVNPGGKIYHLVQTDSGPVLQYLGSAYLFPTDSQISGDYTFSFDWQTIGLPRSRTNFFKFETVYTTQFGATSKESFELLGGTPGWGGTLNFSNYDVYGVNPVPEMTNVALAIFGGVVLVGGAAGALRGMAGIKKPLK